MSHNKYIKVFLTYVQTFFPDTYNCYLSMLKVYLIYIKREICENMHVIRDI